MNVALTNSTVETQAARRQRTTRDAAPANTAGFDALLVGLRPTAQPSLDTTKLSESQMFEAPQREASGGPRSLDEAGALSDQANQSRTDVRARRAASESASRTAQPSEPASSKASPSQRTTERAADALPDQVRRETQAETRTGRVPVDAATRPAQSAPSKETTPAPRSDAQKPVAAAQRESAVTQVRPIDAAGQKTESAAKTLGRVLGAPQSIGAETARGNGSGQSTLNHPKTAAGKSATSSQAPAKQQATQESSFARMVRSLRISPGSRNSSATIRLEPERLGRMSINVKMSGDRISIEVQTETSEARELIASRAMELRSALAQHGLQIERFDVRGDLLGQGVADRPFGSKADDRNEPGSSNRGSRRRTVDPSTTALGSSTAPTESESLDGTDLAALAEVSSAHRQRVDIRI